MPLIEELEKEGNYLFKHRSNLPIYILIGELGYFSYLAWSKQLVNHEHHYWVYCLAVGFLGLAIRIFTVGYTPANTSGRNTDAGQLADELNTTGIYSFVRNPLYLGNYFMWLAIAMLTANFLFCLVFTLAYWLYYERIIFAEEAFLRNKFGKIYTDWASQTPVFIPKLSGYRQPKYPFSWKKVLKKEKNGLAALFLLFYFFETLKVSLEREHFTISLRSIWFWGFVGSSIFYLIFKVIKSRTTWLEEVGR
ncbi:MAG: methyltransferase family protein [Spirosomataceae bacterium]